MNELLLIIAGLYLIEHIVLRYGVNLGASRAQVGPGIAKFDERTKCTVIVCMRNEEANVARCLASLAAIDYPKDLLEILVVEDNSTDNTFALLSSFLESMPNLRILRSQATNDQLVGKSKALAQGMDVAVGDVILITDADCAVPVRWVKRALAAYRQTTGMVAGITILDGPTAWERIQSIDHAYLEAIELGAANISVPLSAIGNNLTINMETYRSIGGLRNLPFCIAEDFALFNGVWADPRWRVEFALHEDLMVTSNACHDFRTWWAQRQRWAKAGGKLTTGTIAIFVLGLLGNLMMLLAPFLAVGNVVLIAIAMKWCADLLLIWPVMQRARRLSWLRYFAFYEAYLFVLAVSIPFMYLSKKVSWKDREIELAEGTS